MTIRREQCKSCGGKGWLGEVYMNCDICGNPLTKNYWIIIETAEGREKFDLCEKHRDEFENHKNEFNRN